MKVNEAIVSRRTIRQYSQKKISAKDLDDMVNAGRLAPSARNLQPLEFVTVDSDGPMDLIYRSVVFGGQIKNIKSRKPCAYIVVLLNVNLKGAWSAYDCGIAAENIVLAAWEKGIGSCILCDIDRYKIADILRIPHDYNVEMVISLGYPGEVCVAEDAEIKKMDDAAYSRDKKGVLHVPKRNLSSIIHRNRF